MLCNNVTCVFAHIGAPATNIFANILRNFRAYFCMGKMAIPSGSGLYAFSASAGKWAAPPFMFSRPRLSSLEENSLYIFLISRHALSSLLPLSQLFSSTSSLHTGRTLSVYASFIAHCAVRLRTYRHFLSSLSLASFTSLAFSGVHTGRGGGEEEEDSCLCSPPLPVLVSASLSLSPQFSLLCLYLFLPLISVSSLPLSCLPPLPLLPVTLSLVTLVHASSCLCMLITFYPSSLHT